MDPISRKISPNIQPPVTPAPATPAQETTRKFEVGSSEVTQAAGQAQTIARPCFDRIRALLNDPAVKSLPREQLREHVIASETKHIFGDNASPDMVAAVTQAFEDDPHLSQLFNRLVSKAEKA
ncbi:MAG TPA: hypothetical protein VH475_26325 [Tepidisphaeraceae bacterium]|jgi:hypothetical protein